MKRTQSANTMSYKINVVQAVELGQIMVAEAKNKFMIGKKTNIELIYIFNVPLK